LPEGPLLRCATCGQLASSCSIEAHAASLKIWDTNAGTTPDARSVERYRTVVTRRLDGVLALLGERDSVPKLLDVGCSSGALLAVARDMGFAVRGVEPAPAAAQSAQRAGFEVFQGLLHEAAYADASFDACVMFEILEHVNEPLALMRECARVLRPGGVLVVNTPNAASWTARAMQARWEGFSLMAMGGHASFFNPASLTLLAERCGFGVARIETRNVRFYEKGQCGAFTYRAAKIAAQLLAMPARWASAGHDLLVYMTKNK
jgi:2-polyprenyl-3-methyl-5-hydroxy-6-metoxy-1,4-benzoquinol methylase